MIYLDTHILVRCYEDKDLGREGRRLLETDEEMLVSPAALLELELLYEISRLRWSSTRVFDGLAETIRLRVCDLPFRTVIEHALQEGWTRDPFDRLIVAAAKARNAPLLTKDERIHRHYRKAVW